MLSDERRDNYVSCFVLTVGGVAAAFATANGDPSKIPNTKLLFSLSSEIKNLGLTWTPADPYIIISTTTHPQIAVS
jgi:hypothetical protein